MHFVTPAVHAGTAREKSFHSQLQKKGEKKEVENLWQINLAFHPRPFRRGFPEPRIHSSGESLTP